MAKSIARRVYEMKESALNKLIDGLVKKVETDVDSSLLREMVVTALKVGEDDLDRGNVRLINASMKELRYALKVFAPYTLVRKVAIFGSARTKKSDPDYKLAKKFSQLIARKGWMVISGAAAGIMQAGNEGAGRANSFGVNIRLPFEQAANPFILDDQKLINFKYFFTRKLIFVSESDATVLCPGGFGTHDEGFETLTLVQTGKATPRPIVCLDPPRSRYWSSFREFLEKQLCRRGMIDRKDLDLIKYTHDAKEAVNYIVNFYSNYHSQRYIKDKLVMRIKKPLPKESIERLNDQFKDIIKKGKIKQTSKPFNEEHEDKHTFDLTRLSLYFNRRHYARLYELIEEINKPQ